MHIEQPVALPAASCCADSCPVRQQQSIEIAVTAEQIVLYPSHHWYHMLLLCFTMIRIYSEYSSEEQIHVCVWTATAVVEIPHFRRTMGNSPFFSSVHGGDAYCCIYIYVHIYVHTNRPYMYVDIL